MQETHDTRPTRGSLILRVGVFVALALVVLTAAQATRWYKYRNQRVAATTLRIPSASDEAAESRELIAFLERRVRLDPGDSVAYAKLAALYLQRLRETGALSDLGLALRAAHASLAIVPGVRNTDALSALALAECASHDFADARRHAEMLTRLDDSGAPYAMLGDALSELGDYAAAERAYGEMKRRSGPGDENVAIRAARMAVLYGDTASAERSFSTALSLELARSAPSRELIAWFDWQRGDTAFFAGDDDAARTDYEAALASYPGYFKALASLGRLKAGRGDLPGAIDAYEAAVRTLPDPTFLAELGDVYALAGRHVDASKRYDLVEFIGRLGKLSGVLYNRQLAMYEADHGRNAIRAYAEAKREFRARRDILGADALAWTALKAGKVSEAEEAMRSALRLGTLDPRLLYHAGMIDLARGQRQAARAYLQRALALNPQFDPFQAVVARRALASLR